MCDLASTIQPVTNDDYDDRVGRAKDTVLLLQVCRMRENLGVVAKLICGGAKGRGPV